MDSKAASARDKSPGIGAEVRESVVLLSVSVAVTAAVTVAAQAALHLLG